MCITTRLHIFISVQHVSSWRDLCEHICLQAACRGHGLQRPGCAVLQPGLRGAETAVCGVRLPVWRPQFSRRTCIPGLQGAGPTLLQDPGGGVAEAHGEKTSAERLSLACFQICWFTSIRLCPVLNRVRWIIHIFHFGHWRVTVHLNTDTLISPFLHN